RAVHRRAAHRPPSPKARHPRRMTLAPPRPAGGKALALDTPLPTPARWTTMGEVRVGDQLLGADGKPTRVVAATEVMHGRPCYEVEFDDGEVIVADADHQWLTWNPQGSDELLPPRVVTTNEIARTLRDELGPRGPSHAVALPASVEQSRSGLLVAAGPGSRWPGDTRRQPWRYFADVRPVTSRPVRCVQVDSRDHLYLAGRGMIPTHNSTLALDFAR